MIPLNNIEEPLLHSVIYSLEYKAHSYFKAHLLHALAQQRSRNISNSGFAFCFFTERIMMSRPKI